MTVSQIKEEMNRMDLAELQEIAVHLLRVRRERDPNRKDEIKDLLDGQNQKWMTLNEFDQRVAE